MKAFRALASASVVALFDEASGGGDQLDINAPRNAPAKHPEQHLDKVYFHSSLDYMEVLSETTMSITHAAISGAPGDSETAQAMAFNKSKATHTLATFSLSYVPLVLVVVGNRVLQPGMPVQYVAQNARFVSPAVSQTDVTISEQSIVGSGGLPAATITYRVIVLKRPPAATGKDLFRFDAITGIVTMGLGKFSSDRRYLQVVPGGTPYGITYGPSIDLNNGAPRSVGPDGTIYDPVPSTVRWRWIVQHAYGTYTGAYGATLDYKGAFAGSPSVLVQAP